jgi:luciferase-type oxidoreductase
MDGFNRAYHRTLASGRMTVGLMTPLTRDDGVMANIALERRVAARADHHGFSALWTRDVPLMVPQGSESESAALDDPFLWLATLGSASENISLGIAAAVLPLRHPLHLAKSALSLNGLFNDRFILGLGSGDREAEFAAFGQDAMHRGRIFRRNWLLVRSALSTRADQREALLHATGGFELRTPPVSRIPMLVVGSARQSLQWIAGNVDGWATYHREEVRQQGRIGLWQSALRERAACPNPSSNRSILTWWTLRTLLPNRSNWGCAQAALRC